MKRFQLTAIACGLALASAAWAQTTTTVVTTTATPTVTSSSTTSYIKRTAPRFESFAGSSDNFSSLASGLRSGTAITLTGDGQTAVFTSPTRPMGYGNITRALDLAQRQLAAQGITDPTPSQLQTALMGGTITGPNGTVTYAGVLQMRADGMGWGQIAHSIGVHPGMGKSASAVPASSAASSGVTTAAGGRVAASGRTTGKPASPGASGRERASIATAAGGSGAAQGSGRGLSSAAGGSANAGGSASAGGAASAGGGHGNAYGRGK
jgi:hypothetical protein